MDAPYPFFALDFVVCWQMASASLAVEPWPHSALWSQTPMASSITDQFPDDGDVSNPGLGSSHKVA